MIRDAVPGFSDCWTVPMWDGTGGPFDLLAENATWTIVGRSVVSKTYDSREAFMRDVIRPFNARMSAPLRPEVRNLYADGKTVISLFRRNGNGAGTANRTRTPMRVPHDA